MITFVLVHESGRYYTGRDSDDRGDRVSDNVDDAVTFRAELDWLKGSLAVQGDQTLPRYNNFTARAVRRTIDVL